MDRMSSGVVVKLKALNHLLSPPSSTFNSTLFRPTTRPFFFAPSSFSAAAPRPPRFSPLSTLAAAAAAAEKANGTALPYGDGVAQEHPSSQSQSQSQSHNNILQVVLVSPQIPGNTGSIARTCAASGVKLHLVEPLGFPIDDTKLKRAGLDYWPYVVVKVHSSWAEFRDYFSLQGGEKRLLAFTKRGTAIHSDFKYRRGDWLVFGSETSGLPAEALVDCKSETYGGGGSIKIPMVDTYVRCLNLSVSVGIAVYEAARQLNYEQLQSSPESSCINADNASFVREDIFA